MELITKEMMMKISERLIFTGSCIVTVAALVYAISGDTWLHVFWGGISGLNLAGAILAIKES